MSLLNSSRMRKYLALLLATPIILTAAAMNHTDVEYSRPNGKPLLLDIHVPDGPGPFAAAIVVHGGGFDQGTKTSYVGPLLEVLTKANIAWFSIDYRLAPDFRFPQPVEDVDNAIRWVKKNAATKTARSIKYSCRRRAGRNRARAGDR